MWLPAAAQPASQERQDDRVKAQHPVAKHKARVLIVDDDAMIRQISKRMLVSIGCDVLLADSGASAVEIYRSNIGQIDLVILDLSMPVMDGAECFEKRKQNDATVRVLICTGHGKHADNEEILSHGALGIVRKPFDLDELSEKVEQALRVELP